MHSFKELSLLFEEKFNQRHFPVHPAGLYNASQYLLSLGGKRIRPILCLMGNELFGDIQPDSYHVATAIELFHNFTLVHDDIMDKAPLRRGMATVHTKYGEPTALLAGDVMLVVAYEYLNRVKGEYIHKIYSLFNTMAKQVCEGQQLDMEFAERQPSLENIRGVSMDEYVEMIGLKTSVLLGTSLQCGAVLGGSGLGNQDHLYAFGKNLGIAFQVQDDYLDAYGNPEKFGKKPGGDILANKQTFLQIKALETARPEQANILRDLQAYDGDDKIQKVLDIYADCNIKEWAMELKQKYMAAALMHLEETAVVSSRKKPLADLAHSLIDREM